MVGRFAEARKESLPRIHKMNDVGDGTQQRDGWGKIEEMSDDGDGMYR